MNTHITPETTTKDGVEITTRPAGMAAPKTWKRTNVLACALLLVGVVTFPLYSPFQFDTVSASITDGVDYQTGLFTEHPELNGNGDGAAMVAVEEARDAVLGELNVTESVTAREAIIAESVQQTSFGFNTKTVTGDTVLIDGPTRKAPDVRITGTYDRWFVEAITPNGEQYFQAEMMENQHISYISMGDDAKAEATALVDNGTGYYQRSLDPAPYKRLFPNEYKVHNDMYDWFTN